MTLNELKDEVLSLGFETRIESLSFFYCAAKRAMERIFADRAVLSAAKIYVVKPKVLTRVKKIRNERGEEQSFALPGRSFSFTACGKGSYLVKDGNLQNGGSFCSSSVRVFGRLVNGGSITFLSGEYTVFDLVSYADSYEDGAIPDFGGERRIPLKDKLTDFASFVFAPKNGEGVSIPGGRFSSGDLILPFDYDGEVILEYRRSPSKPSPDDPDSSLDVPEECISLLPLLTAAYLWLDDDPDKAQYYMLLYKEGMSELRRYSPRSVDTIYRSNGWA